MRQNCEVLVKDEDAQQWIKVLGLQLQGCRGCPQNQFSGEAAVANVKWPISPAPEENHHNWPAWHRCSLTRPPGVQSCRWREVAQPLLGSQMLCRQPAPGQVNLPPALAPCSYFQGCFFPSELSPVDHCRNPSPSELRSARPERTAFALGG